MTRHLSLVESDFEQLHKRVLPRFPFCYLTFKCSQNESHIFEVKDISHSGMQLGLKDGAHTIKKDDKIHGMLRWAGSELEISGSVKWNSDLRLGVEFSTQVSSREGVQEFLDLAQIAKKMKPAHKVSFGVELPVKLQSWLRADGPVEIFVWQHGDGEIAKFQILMMENFIEWEDGSGLKSARVISKRDVDTPLINEDEFVFKFDETICDDKIENSKVLLKNIDPDLLGERAFNFMAMKLGI